MVGAEGKSAQQKALTLGAIQNMPDQSFFITSMPELVTIILQHRRKELLMRGLRWMDIKRLNKEDADIILQRMVDNQVYSLPPNDKRYALPIPADIILHAGIEQN